jgi:hypothetical protein
MELFLVAPLRLGVFALKVFCLVAGRKDWPSATTGQKANGHASPGRGRMGQSCRN